jgi:hypothetical protein
VNNFSMTVKRTDGTTYCDEFDSCQDLILWYVGAAETAGRRVLEAEIDVVAEDGKKIAIIIPNDRSASVRVRVTDDRRHYCTAW